MRRSAVCRPNSIDAGPALRARMVLFSVAVAGALAVVGLAGCQKPLFPEGTPRTQFELHDRMRSRYRPTEQPDVFGRPQPALRARLGRDEFAN